MISVASFSDSGQYNSSDTGIISVWTYSSSRIYYIVL